MEKKNWSTEIKNVDEQKKASFDKRHKNNFLFEKEKREKGVHATIHTGLLTQNINNEMN